MAITLNKKIRCKNLKKINPKIIGIVLLLLSSLIAGSLAVQEGYGDPTLEPAPGDDTGG